MGEEDDTHVLDLDHGLNEFFDSFSSKQFTRNIESRSDFLTKADFIATNLFLSSPHKIPLFFMNTFLMGKIEIKNRNLECVMC